MSTQIQESAPAAERWAPSLASPGWIGEGAPTQVSERGPWGRKWEWRLGSDAAGSRASSAFTVTIRRDHDNSSVSHLGDRMARQTNSLIQEFWLSINNTSVSHREEIKAFPHFSYLYLRTGIFFSSTINTTRVSKHQTTFLYSQMLSMAETKGIWVLMPVFWSLLRDHREASRCCGLLTPRAFMGASSWNSHNTERQVRKWLLPILRKRQQTPGSYTNDLRRGVPELVKRKLASKLHGGVPSFNCTTIS